MPRTPVVLIHGPWLHSASWRPWVTRFTDRGFAVVAPGWPGEPETVGEARRSPGALPEIGLDALTEHYEDIVRSFDIPPVVIGHSVGGLIAQYLLGLGRIRATVAIAPAPIEGAPPGAVFTDPARWPDSAGPSPTVSLSAEQFRAAFANTVPEEASRLFEHYVIPSSRRLLSDLSDGPGSAQRRRTVDTANSRRGPLLLVSGQEDRMVPDEVNRAVYKLYGDAAAQSSLKQFPDRAHSLTIDSGWQGVADHVLVWLAQHGIHGDQP
ncbi:alpha/beta hydrolase [Streptomyces sp. YJ-C3]